MRKIIRTANCPSCGSVKLKISPSNGRVEYYCAECGMHINTILYEKFTSISDKCNNCGKNIFKVKIEENGYKTLWHPFCLECNGKAKLICVDDEGNQFDFDKRQQVAITNSMNSFESRLLKLDNSIYDFNEKVEKLKKKVESTYEYRFK